MVSITTPARIGRNWMPVKNPVGSIGAGGELDGRESYCIILYETKFFAQVKVPARATDLLNWRPDVPFPPDSQTRRAAEAPRLSFPHHPQPISITVFARPAAFFSRRPGPRAGKPARATPRKSQKAAARAEPGPPEYPRRRIAFCALGLLCGYFPFLAFLSFPR